MLLKLFKQIFVFCIVIYFCNNNAVSSSILSIDLNKNRVLMNRNEFQKIYPASLTKILTIMNAIDNINHNDIRVYDKINISYNASIQESKNVNLNPGNSVSIKDLILLSGLISANDAAYALSEIMNNKDYFVQEMNHKAKAIGMIDSHFVNSTGLFDYEQYSTASDIALLMQYFVNNYKSYIGVLNANGFFSSGKYYAPWNKVGMSFKCINAYKTGFTAKSGANIAIHLMCKKMNSVVVIIGEPNQDTRDATAIRVLQDAVKKLSFDIDYETQEEVYQIYNENEVFTMKFLAPSSLIFINTGIDQINSLNVLGEISQVIYNEHLKEHIENAIVKPVPKAS